MPRLSPAVARHDFEDCDLVIEAAMENEAITLHLLSDVAQSIKPDGVSASNTSSISITRLAAVTGQPKRFIGMHFIDPASHMQLVELFRGVATDDDLFETARAFCVKLGTTVTVAEDFAAFIVNRMLLPTVKEAIYALHEGVGCVDAVDTAMRLGANHPMGPVQLVDVIGLDICLSIMQALHEGLADTKYPPCPLPVKYVEAGWLGRKTQCGFCDYRQGTPIPSRTVGVS